MAYGWIDSGCTQSAHATDAQDDLLADTHLLVAAIERVGDALICGLVIQHIAVKQKERNTSHFSSPDLTRYRSIRKFNFDPNCLTMRIPQEIQRHVVKVVLGVNLLLPGIRIQ